jgi:NAD(P)-dependent dehydrogenase (short-subunit alcohol dehydrogenase family)
VLISRGRLGQDALADKVVIVTGAGGGIGLEAARALLWLGSSVVIVDADRPRGLEAANRLAREWPAERVAYTLADVTDERSVGRLAREVAELYGGIDIVLDTAAVSPSGDASVGAPASDPASHMFLARACTTGMKVRGRGVFASAWCPGAGAAEAAGAGPGIATANADLAELLEREFRGSGVWAFTIGPEPGPDEAAGAGMAAAVTMAERYAGRSICSGRALIDAGIATEEHGCCQASAAADATGQEQNPA